MQKILDVGFWLTITFYFAFLISLVSPSRHVDPDFFQFLRDSEYYLRFELPPFIQSLPANPILIGVLYRMLSDHFTEIEISLLINAFSASGAIAILYYLTKRKVGVILAGMVAVFLITNPIVFASATSNNTEVLFSFFTMLILFLVWKEKLLTATLLTSIGILIRYEAVLIFLALIFSHYFNKEKFVQLIKHSLLFAVSALPILFVLLRQNETKEAMNTPFLTEVFARIEDIPEERFFTHFPFALLSYQELTLSNQSLFKIFLGSAFWFLFIFKLHKNIKKNKKLILFSTAFTILFLIFHICFPAYLERYFVPTLFTFSFSILLITGSQSKLFKSIFLILMIVLIAINSRAIFFKKPGIIIESADYITAITIKKIIDSKSDYILLSPYPETIEYYYRDRKNIQISSVIDFKSDNNCDTLECAIYEYKEKQLIIPYNSLFDWGMTGIYDNSLRKWYESIGFYELGNIIKSKKVCLWHNEEFPRKNTFVKLYKQCPK